ncbi:hypothetical protein F4778DRAFT_59840 [Xylariomycetidae sp. FL2044]|nr:hypothetical protein F4778DRAFT_59840 [Xylariomycetidae sp. FL2044]
MAVLVRQGPSRWTRGPKIGIALLLHPTELHDHSFPDAWGMGNKVQVVQLAVHRDRCLAGNRATPWFPAPPPRPKTPGGYFPTPDAIIDPTEAARHLRNHEHQSPGTPLHVHTLAVDRFPGRDSLHPPQSPTVSVSPKLSPTASISSKLSSKSTSSMKAFTRSATKVFGKGLEKGRSSVSQAGAGLAKAVGVARIEEKPRLAITVPASAIVATPGSLQDLYHGRQLPRLYIPDARAQAGTELSRRLSTDTLDSPTFKSILALSPRSRDLRHQLHEDHSQDIMAEIRNMLSARRRIRKSEFGRAVHEYLMARQNWEDLPSRFDPDDIKLMKEIVQALEDQKLAAEKLVTRHPHLYLGMRHVKERYCSRDVIARG